MTGQQVSEGRGRGRPRAVTREEVQAVAFDLFTRKGYAETSVEEISSALGIGRSTFFRYFPTKSAVLWRDFTESEELLREALSATPETVPIFAAIRDAIILSTRFEEHDRAILTLRMELVKRSSTLFNDNAAATGRWAQVIADFVAGRAEPEQPVIAIAIAYAFTGATGAATQLWMDGKAESFGDLLAEGLEMVAGAMRGALVPAGVLPHP